MTLQAKSKGHRNLLPNALFERESTNLARHRVSQRNLINPCVQALRFSAHEAISSNGTRPDTCSRRVQNLEGIPSICSSVSQAYELENRRQSPESKGCT